MLLGPAQIATLKKFGPIPTRAVQQQRATSAGDGGTDSAADTTSEHHDSLSPPVLATIPIHRNDAKGHLFLPIDMLQLRCLMEEPSRNASPSSHHVHYNGADHRRCTAEGGDPNRIASREASAGQAGGQQDTAGTGLFSGLTSPLAQAVSFDVSRLGDDDGNGNASPGMNHLISPAAAASAGGAATATGLTDEHRPVDVPASPPRRFSGSIATSASPMWCRNRDMNFALQLVADELRQGLRLYFTDDRDNEEEAHHDEGGVESSGAANPLEDDDSSSFPFPSVHDADDCRAAASSSAVPADEASASHRQLMKRRVALADRFVAYFHVNFCIRLGEARSGLVRLPGVLCQRTYAPKTMSRTLRVDGPEHVPIGAPYAVRDVPVAAAAADEHHHPSTAALSATLTSFRRGPSVVSRVRRGSTRRSFSDTSGLMFDLRAQANATIAPPVPTVDLLFDQRAIMGAGLTYVGWAGATLEVVVRNSFPGDHVYLDMTFARRLRFAGGVLSMDGLVIGRAEKPTHFLNMAAASNTTLLGQSDNTTDNLAAADKTRAHFKMQLENAENAIGPCDAGSNELRLVLHYCLALCDVIKEGRGGRGGGGGAATSKPAAGSPSPSSPSTFSLNPFGLPDAIATLLPPAMLSIVNRLSHVTIKRVTVAADSTSTKNATGAISTAVLSGRSATSAAAPPRAVVMPHEFQLEAGDPTARAVESSSSGTVATSSPQTSVKPPPRKRRSASVSAIAEDSSSSETTSATASRRSSSSAAESFVADYGHGRYDDDDQEPKGAVQRHTLVFSSSTTVRPETVSLILDCLRFCNSSTTPVEGRREVYVRLSPMGTIGPVTIFDVDVNAIDSPTELRVGRTHVNFFLPPLNAVEADTASLLRSLPPLTTQVFANTQVIDSDTEHFAGGYLNVWMNSPKAGDHLWLAASDGGWCPAPVKSVEEALALWGADASTSAASAMPVGGADANTTASSFARSMKSFHVAAALGVSRPGMGNRAVSRRRGIFVVPLATPMPLSEPVCGANDWRTGFVFFNDERIGDLCCSFIEPSQEELAAAAAQLHRSTGGADALAEVAVSALSRMATMKMGGAVRRAVKAANTGGRSTSQGPAFLEATHGVKSLCVVFGGGCTPSITSLQELMRCVRYSNARVASATAAAAAAANAATIGTLASSTTAASASSGGAAAAAAAATFRTGSRDIFASVLVGNTMGRVDAFGRGIETANTNEELLCSVQVVAQPSPLRVLARNSELTYLEASGLKRLPLMEYGGTSDVIAASPSGSQGGPSSLTGGGATTTATSGNTTSAGQGQQQPPNVAGDAAGTSLVMDPCGYIKFDIAVGSCPFDQPCFVDPEVADGVRTQVIDAPNSADVIAKYIVSLGKGAWELSTYALASGGAPASTGGSAMPPPSINPNQPPHSVGALPSHTGSALAWSPSPLALLPASRRRPVSINAAASGPVGDAMGNSQGTTTSDSSMSQASSPAAATTAPMRRRSTSFAQRRESSSLARSSDITTTTDGGDAASRAPDPMEASAATLAHTTSMAAAPPQQLTWFPYSSCPEPPQPPAAPPSVASAPTAPADPFSPATTAAGQPSSPPSSSSATAAAAQGRRSRASSMVFTNVEPHEGSPSSSTAQPAPATTSFATRPRAASLQRGSEPPALHLLVPPTPVSTMPMAGAPHVTDSQLLQVRALMNMGFDMRFFVDAAKLTARRIYRDRELLAIAYAVPEAVNVVFVGRGRRKDVNFVLRGLGYQNADLNPIQLMKLGRITIAMSGGSDCPQVLLLDVKILPVDDPLEIVLIHSQLKYRLGSITDTSLRYSLPRSHIEELAARRRQYCSLALQTFDAQCRDCDDGTVNTPSNASLRTGAAAAAATSVMSAMAPYIYGANAAMGNEVDDEPLRGVVPEELLFASASYPGIPGLGCVWMFPLGGVLLQDPDTVWYDRGTVTVEVQGPAPKADWVGFLSPAKQIEAYRSATGGAEDPEWVFVCPQQEALSIGVAQGQMNKVWENTPSAVFPGASGGGGAAVTPAGASALMMGARTFDAYVKTSSSTLLNLSGGSSAPNSARPNSSTSQPAASSVPAPTRPAWNANGAYTLLVHELGSIACNTRAGQSSVTNVTFRTRSTLNAALQRIVPHSGGGGASMAVSGVFQPEGDVQDHHQYSQQPLSPCVTLPFLTAFLNALSLYLTSAALGPRTVKLTITDGKNPVATKANVTVDVSPPWFGLAKEPGPATYNQVTVTKTRNLADSYPLFPKLMLSLSDTAVLPSGGFLEVFLVSGPNPGTPNQQQHPHAVTSASTDSLTLRLNASQLTLKPPASNGPWCDAAGNVNLAGLVNAGSAQLLVGGGKDIVGLVTCVSPTYIRVDFMLPSLASPPGAAGGITWTASKHATGKRLTEFVRSLYVTVQTTGRRRVILTLSDTFRPPPVSLSLLQNTLVPGPAAVASAGGVSSIVSSPRSNSNNVLTAMSLSQSASPPPPASLGSFSPSLSSRSLKPQLSMATASPPPPAAAPQPLLYPNRSDMGVFIVDVSVE